MLDEFLDTEEMIVKIKLQKSRKVRRKCDKVIAKMAQKADWETYALQQPRDVAFTVFLALDSKGQKAWAQHAVGHIHDGHLRQMANHFRARAVKSSQTLQADVNKEISAGELELIQIVNKRKEGEQRVHLDSTQDVAHINAHVMMMRRASGDDFMSTKKSTQKGSSHKGRRRRCARRLGTRRLGTRRLCPNRLVTRPRMM